MTSLVLRGIAQRKLRSALTGLAVLLGVAMIAGTYVLTDQIRNGFENLQRSVNRGVAAVLTPRTAFESDFTEQESMPDELIGRVRRVPGVARAEGQLVANGALVVRGDYVENKGGNAALVVTTLPEPFDPVEVTRGRKPTRSGEIGVIESVAKDQRLKVGSRVGLATRDGVKPVTVSGVFELGGVESLGGTSVVAATFADAQRWFDREGQASSIVAAAEPGVSQEEIVRRIRAVVPPTVKVRTGRQSATEQADDLNDQVGSFLTPALLTFAGAALLVGAFIIFNTFSITVAERTREFAMLRTLGATRRQVLAAVAGEAALVGAVASALGLGCGVGFARLINALFESAGFGLPTSGTVLEPRTIAISLAVGTIVTLMAATVPALRATRVPPVVALGRGIDLPPSRHRRLAPYVAGAVTAGGLGLVALGLFGSGPADSRLATMGVGAVLVFVGAALSARWFVRPIAAAVGLPLERAFRTTGKLARENAMRNPTRTAVTAASLMVGLGLVVFVAVFANGLKTSFSESIARLIKADLIVSARGFDPVPAGTAGAARGVPGVGAVSTVLFDQVEVNGRPVKQTTDTLDATEPGSLLDTYAFEWVDGSDDVVPGLRRGQALVEEQFAKTHRIDVGDRFTVETPSRRRSVLTAVAEYRDPQILQGVIVGLDTFRAVSTVRDPFVVLVSKSAGADAAAVERGVKDALRRWPAAEVRSNAEYRESVEDQLDQLVYLLYALLALSVVISLFGIANSLFLSVHERTREIGLLRAVGTTREQVRRIVRYESVITAVIGGLLGTAIGVLFAWLITQSLTDLGLGFDLPAGQLVAFLAVSVVVGMVAAAAPARRGSRLDVLEALQHE